MEEICLYLEEKIIDENKTLRPEDVYTFAVLFSELLNQNKEIPPVLNRLFTGANSYLSRNNLCINNSKIVLYSMLNFAKTLYDINQNQQEEETK